MQVYITDSNTIIHTNYIKMEKKKLIFFAIINLNRLIQLETQPFEMTKFPILNHWLF